MDLFGVLLRREFLVRPRRKWFYWKRILPLLVGAATILIVAAASRGGTAAGLKLVQSLTNLLIVICCVFAAPAAAESLFQEKENRSLEIASLSDIPISVMLMSKFLISTLVFAITMLSILPIFILCVSLGGTTAVQVAMVLLVLFCNILFYVGLGVMIGVIAHNRRWMGGLLGVSVVLWYIAVPLSGAPHWLRPHYVAHDIMMGGAEAWWPYCLFTAGGALVWLVIAARLLKRSLVEFPGPLIKVRLRRTGESICVRERMGFEDHPISWEMMTIQFGGRIRLLVKSIVSLLIIFALSVCVSVMGYRPSFATFGWTFALTTTTVFLVGTLASYARIFRRDRQHRAAELMLLTDIKPEIIPERKLLAVLMAYKIYGITAAISLSFAYLVLAPSADGVYFSAAFFAIVYHLALWFFVCVVAMHYSLCIGEFSLLAVFVGGFVYYFIAYLLVGVAGLALGHGAGLYASSGAAIVLHIVLGVVLLESLKKRYRARLLKHWSRN